MAKRKTLASAVTWSAIDSWGSSLFSLVVTILLARLLEPRAFGLVAMATVYVSLVEIFVSQGLGAALVQRRVLERLHLDTAFWMAVCMAILLVGVSMFAAGPVAGLYGEPQLAPLVRWLSLGLFINALNGTQQAILQRELAFQELAIRSVVASVAGGIVGVAAALLGFGVWSLVAQMLSGGVVRTLVLWRVSDWRPTIRFSVQHFRELFGFSASILGTNLLNLVNRRSDDLLIGAFLGPVALGYYSVAYGLIRKLTMLLSGVTTRVAFPTFSRVQHDPARMRKGFYTATRYTSLIAFPAFIGIMLVAPELVRGLYGPKWAPAIPVMQVLALIGIIHSVFYFNGTIMAAAGKPSWRLGLTAINATANLIAFTFALQWGIVAVALAYVLRAYLMSPLPLWLIRRLIQIDYGTYLRQYAAPLVGSAVMAGGLLGLKYLIAGMLAPIPELGLSVIVGILVYSITVYLCVPQLWQELWKTARGGIPGSPSPAPANPS